MNVKTFRKKPVEIQAMQLTDAHSVSLGARWCGGSNAKSPHEVQIETLEGTMTASLGDWIIKGVAGEFYPCKPDIFAATYDEVSS